MINGTTTAETTDDQIQRTQGREVGRPAHRRDHAMGQTTMMSDGDETIDPVAVLYSRMLPNKGGREHPRL